MKHNMDIKNFTIIKRDGSKDRFSLDKIMGAICKAFNSVEEPVDLGTVSKVLSHLDVRPDISYEDIQDQVEIALMKEGHYKVSKGFFLYRQDRRHYNPGRPKTKQLCSRMPDEEACRAFTIIQEWCSPYIDNPTQYISCFLLALFSRLGTETPFGKIKYYWEMLCKHIKGLKIPALRTIQNAISLFSSWKSKAKHVLFTAYDNIKYKAWSKLQSMIEKMMPKIEPQLAVSIC
jgi:hypothetical protein